QSQPLAGRVDFSIGADFGVTMVGGPFGDVGMKTLAVFYDGSEEAQVTAFPQFTAQPPREFVAGLGFDGDLAIRAKLRSQPGEEQADEMIDFGDGCDGTLSPATAGALLDADGGRNAGDEVHVGAGELLDELPGIDTHRVEK